MNTQHHRTSLRLSLSASILALLLTGFPLVAHADEPVAETPAITSPAMPDGTVGVDYDYQLTSNVSPVTFSVSGLPDGVQADPLSGVVSGTPTTEGEFTVRLEAIGTEPTDGTTQVRYEVVEIVPAPVTVPVITSPSPPHGAVGVPYGFQVTSNVSPVRFSITGLPDGLTADAGTGLITGTPTVDGEFVVRLEAIGAEPTGDTQVVYATLVIDPAPAPVITSPPLPGGTVGVPYSFQVTSNVSPVRFSITELPDGLTADAGTGLITGTPTVDGEFTVRLEAIGPLPTGGVAMVVYQTVVIAPNTDDPPVVTSAALPDGTVGTAYSFQLEASVPSTFSAVGLPAGLSLDPAGLITGTPTTAGPATITVTATAGGFSSEPVSFSITIHPRVTPPVAPPVFTSTPPTTATVGTIFSFTPTVTSDTPVEFALIGNVPGLSFDPATGRLSGTPTKAGSYTLSIVATNGAPTTATLAFTLTVAAVVTTTPPTDTPSAPGAASQVPPADQVARNDSGTRSAPTSSGSSTLAETGSDGLGLVAEGLAGLLLLAAGTIVAIGRGRRGTAA